MSHNADDLLAQAIAASKADQAEQAISLFRQAAQAAPTAAIPHFLLGAELAELNRSQEAEAAYAQALLLAPDLHMARFQMGLLQFLTGRVAMALLTWDALGKLPESLSLQRAVTGFAALAHDQADDAVRLLEQAIAASDADPVLAQNLKQLIERIRAQLNQPAATEEGQPPQDALHVLLANYQSDGPPH